MTRGDAIYRLIELKSHELNSMRSDFGRLEQLALESQGMLDEALQRQEDFIEQIRTLESGARLLSAGGMIEQRNFLKYLQQQSREAENILQEIKKQRDFAQQGLKEAHMEMKSLEIIAERRSNTERLKQNRHQFRLADDEELRRAERVGGVGG